MGASLNTMQATTGLLAHVAASAGKSRPGARVGFPKALGMGYQPPGRKGQSVGLVRDPVCGTFVLPSKALTSGSGSNTRYFCSEKCRNDFGHRRNTEETR